MKTLKKILTALLALAVFAGTLFLESGMEHDLGIIVASKITLVPSVEGVELVRDAKSAQVKGEIDLKSGDTMVTSQQQSALIRFADNGIIRLAPQSRLIVRFDEKPPTENDLAYLFVLEQGKLWGNTAFTNGMFNVQAGGVLVLPGKAVFNVDFDREKTLIQVVENQLKVGLVPLSFSLSKLVNGRDASLINSFLVAQGGQTTIFTSKISESADALRQLLYSKLIKEFQYSLVDKEVWNKDSWIRQNLIADGDFVQTVAQQKLRAINSRNLKISALNSFSYQLRNAADRFADVLTISGERVMRRDMQNLFDHLLDSEYLLVFGRSTEAKERLALFRQLVQEKMALNDQDYRSLLLSNLRESYEDLSFVLPDDPLFEVKSTINDMLSQYLGVSESELVEKFYLIRDYMNYAYGLADKNALLARLTLEQYYTRFTNFVKTEKTRLASIKDFLSEDNQIMDNLLRQFSQFYQDGFFSMKHALETQWLALLPEGGDKNEERQTISSTKIDFLKQLQNFFLDGKVSLKDARLIAFRLINEIKDLQTDAAVGVTQLFALRLQDYGQFLRFLNSTELATLQGASFRKKYDEFLAAQRERISIEQAVQEFLGEQPVITQVTPEQILDEVKSDFASIGVVDLQFGSFVDFGQRFITVQGAIAENIVFQGQYDWDRKLISDVRVGGKVLSAEAIRLDSLANVLAPKQPVLPSLPPVTTQEKTEEVEVSKAERVAKILLLQKLKANDITVKEADIKVTDLSGGVFVVSNANLISKKEVVFSFTFKNKENLAEAVLVSTPKGDRALPDVILLADLSEKVAEIYTEQ